MSCEKIIWFRLCSYTQRTLWQLQQTNTTVGAPECYFRTGRDLYIASSSDYFFLPFVNVNFGFILSIILWICRLGSRFPHSVAFGCLTWIHSLVTQRHRLVRGPFVFFFADALRLLSRVCFSDRSAKFLRRWKREKMHTFNCDGRNSFFLRMKYLRLTTPFIVEWIFFV